MASIFGEKDAEAFLKHRVKLVKARNVPKAPMITPPIIREEVAKFLAITPDCKSKKGKRKKIIKKLVYWSLDKEINRQNINSYKTRSAITSALLGEIFQNCIGDNIDYILDSLKKIVFSRVTYIGSKGEPSPIVHDTIISGVGRILTAHFYEIERLKEIKVDQLTKIKLIKEINKAKDKTGSLAFSADPRKNDDFKHKYPLPDQYVKSLLKILNHYQYSAWPESREKATDIFNSLKAQMGFDLDQGFLDEEN